MVGRLADKVVVVTGGARGIGGATAKRLAAEGAKVVIADILAAEAEETVGAINGGGGEALFVKTDVTQEEACRALAEATVERFGRLDVIVTCAGILQGAYQPLENLDVEVFERVQSVNVRGTFLAVKHAVPHIKRSGGGVVLCISSGAGVRSSSSSIAYGTSKAAVHGLVMTLQPRLEPQGIRVHAICPGSIDTALKRENVADAARAAGRAVPEALASAGLGDPDGVAKVIAFLASDEADFVRGTIFTR
ncbi:MAG TPA: glucose 1-dehydrogenase [Chloroflexota bacterium]|nr:glucose 1-dehydrogenase [Chloroflexota bacterium]